MDAANAKTQSFGGTLMDSAQQAQMASEQSSALNLNMGALGGAVMGVGGALTLLSQLFASLGLEELAEPIQTIATVFMVLGSVMSVLSTIAPMLGMSFTTAGI